MLRSIAGNFLNTLLNIDTHFVCCLAQATSPLSHLLFIIIIEKYCLMYAMSLNKNLLSETVCVCVEWRAPVQRARTCFWRCIIMISQSEQLKKFEQLLSKIGVYAAKRRQHIQFYFIHSIRAQSVVMQLKKNDQH